MSDFFYRALFYFCVCGVPRRRRSARTPCRKKQSSDCAGSRRLSTIAKRIARVGRDARDEGISWRSKARVFCSIRAVVRIKRRGKRDEFWMFVCRPMRFVRFLCVYASLQKREKKSESQKRRVWLARRAKDASNARKASRRIGRIDSIAI